ncbi:MAG TPA: hypothetical protein VN635_03065 [Conexibacter sp.]|nr:hypothetical protein [Conexibacter sp.]
MRERLPRLLPAALAIAALGACAAVAAAGAASSARTAQLTADRTTVRPGEQLELRGSGFPGNAHLTLLARSPHGPRARIGDAVTGSRGTFVATIRIRSRAAAGAVVALACHDACRVKASVGFRIVRR